MLRVSIVFLVILSLGIAGVSAFGATAHAPSQEPIALNHATANETTTVSEGGQPTDSFPPGASVSGIDNASRLVQVHATKLNATSYVDRSTWQEVTRVTGPNGTVSNVDVNNYSITVEHDTNESAVHIRSANASNQYWLTDDATATNITNTEYGHVSAIYEYSHNDAYSARIAHSFVPSSQSLIHPYLRDLDYEHVETTTRNNRTLHTYSSTGINQTVEPNHGDTPVTSTTETINATVVVSERGIIRSFTAHETHSLHNESVTVEHRYTAGQIGTANASAPAWVTEEIARFNTSYVKNGSAVALTHLGGRSVTNTSLWLNTPTSSAQTVINGTIEPGDKLYVALAATNDSNRTLVTSINEPPTINHSFVSLHGGNLSTVASRTVMNEYDSGVQLEVTINRGENTTASTETTAMSSIAGHTTP